MSVEKDFDLREKERKKMRVERGGKGGVEDTWLHMRIDR